MFTGLIQAIGRVVSIDTRGGDCRIVIDTPNHAAFDAVHIGDSIAHAGVCLTVVSIDGRQFGYDVSTETLSRTTLNTWRPGSAVNLESSLRLGDPLGGHLVSGHVDGVGTLTEQVTDARATRLTFRMPSHLAPFVAEKGSIAVDGVSLTVNTVTRDTFSVAIIPHTAKVTTLGALTVGADVNLEIDQIARYLARMREFGT